MTRTYRTHEEVSVEHFRNHPEEIAPYLEIAFEESKKDQNWAAFMIALRIAVEARCSIKELAETVLKVSGRENEIVHAPHFIEDHTSRLPLTKKIEALGWNRTVSLEEGIKRMLLASNVTHQKPLKAVVAA